ncbi:MAG: hypothetical protein WC375_06590, partial [Methanomassiliicoccales archaeon]
DGHENTHRHVVSIDANGNGFTTQIIKYLIDFDIPDHVHEVVNFVIDDVEIDGITHTHELVSVAITQVLPVLDPFIDIAVQAFAEYDPTECTGYINFYKCPCYEWNETDTWTYKDGHRMMFNSILYPGIDILKRTFYMDLYVGHNLATNPENAVLFSNGYVLKASQSSSDDTCSLDIMVKMGYTAYTVEVSPGRFITIPAEPISDGTRVTLVMNAYGTSEPLGQNSEGSSTNKKYIFTIDVSSLRQYMNLEVIASACVDGERLQRSGWINIVSSTPWLPSIKPLLYEPINDDVYLEEAYDKIQEIGASQIYDAVRLAAQRLTSYQYANPQWKDAHKVIFLLSDGDENMSQYALEQAVDEVNFINGKNQTPLLSVGLGRVYPSDSLVLKKMSLMTGAKTYHIVDVDASEIEEVIDRIVASGDMGVNTGVYGNLHTLILDSLLSQTALRDYVVSGMGTITYRYRYSLDQWKWEPWSEWRDVAQVVTLPLSLEYKSRYVQYEVRLHGSEKFETPDLYNGMAICYYKSQSLSTFFLPVDINIDNDDYVSSVHVTHTGVQPDTSTINYGFVQLDSVDVNDYYSVTRPAINPNKQSILLSRYNEPLITDNVYGRIYTALNGRWSENTAISVYRINNENPNGVLVPPLSYSSNHEAATVTFTTLQPSTDTFVLCVEVEPTFRMLCNVVNYGPEAVSIDHIGVMYNIAKRVPRDSSGNIIHTPFYKRFMI